MMLNHTVWGLGFGVWGLRLSAPDLKLKNALECRGLVAGLCIHAGHESKVWGSGFLQSLRRLLHIGTHFLDAYASVACDIGRLRTLL